MTTDPIVESRIGPQFFRINLGAWLRAVRSRPDPAARVGMSLCKDYHQDNLEKKGEC